MKSNDPTNFSSQGTFSKNRTLLGMVLQQTSTFLLKYEIVSGSTIALLLLFAKSQKKREAIKKRKPERGFRGKATKAAVLLKLVHKKSLTQCLKEMLASK